MPRQMPILEHHGEKFVAGQPFWGLPQDILIYAFKNLTYNETQVLIYLVGNKPKSKYESYRGWQISNIEDCIGGNDSTIRAARRVLMNMGFIRQEQCREDRDTYSSIVVDFDWIRTVIRNNWSKSEAIARNQNRSGAPQPLFASK